MELLTALRIIAKHLPGQHDQASHGRGRGKGGMAGSTPKGSGKSDIPSGWTDTLGGGVHIWKKEGKTLLQVFNNDAEPNKPAFGATVAEVDMPILTEYFDSKEAAVKWADDIASHRVARAIEPRGGLSPDVAPNLYAKYKKISNAAGPIAAGFRLEDSDPRFDGGFEKLESNSKPAAIPDLSYGKRVLATRNDGGADSGYYVGKDEKRKDHQFKVMTHYMGSANSVSYFNLDQLRVGTEK